MRQIILGGHGRIGEQDGDDRHFAFESGRELDAHEVVGIVQTASTFVIGDLEPFGPDDGYDEAAVVKRFVEDFGVARAGGDAVDVAEGDFGSEVHVEVVMDSTGGILAVFAAVGDENLLHCLCDPWLTIV